MYHGDALPPGRAALVAVVALVVMVVAQVATWEVTGSRVLASVVGNITLLAWLGGFARSEHLRPVQLGIARAKGAFFVAALLIGMSTWFINIWLMSHVHLESPKELGELVEQPGLVPAIAAIALMPALAEELLFRGVLARSFEGWIGGVGAVVLSSAMFAGYHLVWVQMVPTFILGLLLGFVTLRARSVAPAMLAHFVNNAIVIVVSRGSLPAFNRALESHGGPTLAIAVLLLAAGIALAASVKQERGG